MPGTTKYYTTHKTYTMRNYYVDWVYNTNWYTYMYIEATV